MSLGRDARDLIDAAKGGDDPADADAVRIRAKIAVRLSAATAAGAATTLTPKSVAAAKLASAGKVVVATSAVGPVAKVLLVAAVAASAVVTGAVVFRASPPPPVAIVRPHTTANERGTGGGAPLSSSRRREMNEGLPDAASQVPASPAREMATAEPEAAPPADVKTPLEVKPPADVKPKVEVAPVTPAARGAPPARLPAEPAASPASASPRLVSPPAVQLATPDAVVAEAALLQRARSALATGDGVEALARLDEHAQRFPRGALTEEQKAARVLALCAAGRAVEARAAATAFLASTPHSPLAPQVTRACAPR